jgi:hypothetical protein
MQHRGQKRYCCDMNNAWGPPAPLLLSHFLNTTGDGLRCSQVHHGPIPEWDSSFPHKSSHIRSFSHD